MFNEGYSATAGDEWLRPALCEDALRLGRILAGLAPREPEVHGLVALMAIQASRSRARVGRDGRPVLLLEQDRSRWDRILIVRGLADALGQISPSPVVELNRSVAVAVAFGPPRGSRSPTGRGTSPRSRPTSCCRASAAIC